jgi:hypothetical protein
MVSLAAIIPIVLERGINAVCRVSFKVKLAASNSLPFV